MRVGHKSELIGQRMEGFKPARAVLPLGIRKGIDHGWEYGGSTFRLWNPKCFITAAHNIADIESSNILVVYPFEPEEDLKVVNVTRHPTADLALLWLDEEPYSDIQSFHEIMGFYFGLSIWTFGLASLDLGGGKREFIQRALSGNIQRRFIYESPLYSYNAIELSTPIPKGFSGAPVYSVADPRRVVGVATATIETEMLEVYEVPEHRNDKRTLDKIQYGVCVYLHRIEQWLNDNIPRE